LKSGNGYLFGLEFLKPNHAGVMKRKDRYEPVNYGVIKIEGNLLTYWNPFGLSVISPLINNNVAMRVYLISRMEHGDIKYLIDNGYAETVELKYIERVIF